MEKEKGTFHVDMSGRIYKNKTIGIALVGTETKIHLGCALKGNLVKLIKRRLFKKNIFEDSAKLYAICISLLVKGVKDNIKTLIICNDEDFRIVKDVLSKLLKDYDSEIISISEFRKRLGRNIGSLADNYANIYRKRGLKPNRWAKGKELNIVPVTYNLIKQSWEECQIKIK
jgi:hypothetical protein